VREAATEALGAVADPRVAALLIACLDAGGGPARLESKVVAQLKLRPRWVALSPPCPPTAS